MKPGDFPIGSMESRAAARMQVERGRETQERIEIICHVSRPRRDYTQPLATPWQDISDGRSMRIVFRRPDADSRERT